MSTELQDALEANLTPEAIALIAAHLQTVYGETDAAGQVAWFRNLLIQTVGGPEEFGRLCDEAGA